MGLARRSGHEHGGFSTGSVQLRVSRWALGALRGRVEQRTGGCGDFFGHALDLGFRQLADGTGEDETGLFACLGPELPAAALGCDTEGGDLR